VDTAMTELDELEPTDSVSEPVVTQEAQEGAERRREEGAAGLIEIAAVILVVAILTIGGLFLFGAFSGGSQDSVAQQNASNALTDARATLSENGGAFPGATNLQADLSTAEPNVSFVTGTATGGSNVSVDTTGSTVTIASSSTSGKCFWIEDNASPTGGTTYATTQESATPCAASAPPAATAFSKNSWNAG
jgi:type II secretory pathway pseudopilin PulG